MNNQHEGVQSSMAPIYTTHSKFTGLLVITALALLLHTLVQSFFAMASI